MIIHLAASGSQELPGTNASDDHLSRWEWILFVVLAVVSLLLRLIYIHQFRVDSDEPQHLHVVWGWAQGLTDYRDFFDNHTPLFHIIYAPVLKAIGERPDILILMRLSLFPLYLFGAWCIYRLGRVLFNRRIGAWAALFSSIYPYYFFPSIEFRADNLWGPLWFFTLVLMTTGPLSPVRSFYVGLLFGALWASSTKSVLLLGAFVLAVMFTYVLSKRFRIQCSAPRLAANLLTALAGAIIVPGLLIAFFLHRHALDQFIYCAIQHNLIPGTLEHQLTSSGFLAALVGLVFVVALARWILAKARTEVVGAKRILILLTAAVYLAFVRTLKVTRQDFIPYDPLMILLVTPLLLSALQICLGRLGFRPPLFVRSVAPAFLGIVGIVWVLAGRSIFHNGTAGHIRYVAEVLRLTTPDDYVMDYKGESIFRRRPFYFVLEPVTRDRIRAGLITDNIPECLIATGTHVVLRDTNRLKQRTPEFLRANYVPVGQVCVAGKLLAPSATGSYEFDLAIAGTYAVTTKDSVPNGTLDGTAYTSPRMLSPGRHTLQLAAQPQAVVVIWSRALEKGFSPFNPPPFVRVESEF